MIQLASLDKVESCLRMRKCRLPSRILLRQYNTLPPHRPTSKPVKPLRRNSNPAYELRKAVQFAGLPENVEAFPAHWPTASGLSTEDTPVYNAAIKSIESGLVLAKEDPSSSSEIWSQVFEQGFARIHEIGQVDLLNLSTMVAISRVSQSCLEETRKHWPIFRTFLLDLSQRRTESFQLRKDVSIMGTHITRWAFSELDFNDEGGAERVVNFWRALIADRKGPVSLPSEFFAAIAIAYSRLPIDLITFLSELSKNGKLKSREFVHEHLGESTIPYLKRLQKREREWIDQAELAMLWASDRGGERGLISRARRWADRRDLKRLQRVWKAVEVASGPEGWLKTVWIDEQDVEGMVDSKPVEEEAEEDQTPPDIRDGTFSPALVASFMLNFLRLGDEEGLASIWSLLSSRSLEPTEGIWVTLIAGYAACKDATSARQALQAMIDRNIPITANVRAYFARASFRSGDISQGLREVQALVKDSSEANPIPTIVCNRLIADLLASGFVDQANSLMLNMPSTGEGQISVATVNTMLAHYASPRHLNLPALRQALKYLGERQLQPDTATFNTMIQGYIQADQREAADKMLRVMESMSIEPNERTYAPLIHDLVSRGLFNETKALVKRMEEKGKPNEFVYSSVIRGYCDQPLSQQNIFKTGLPENIHQAHLVAARMKKRNIPLASPAYNSLISAHFDRKSREGAKMAIAWFEEMLASAQTRGKRVFPDSWFIMLSNLWELGMYPEAKRVLQAMDAHGFEPRGKVDSVVSKLRKVVK